MEDILNNVYKEEALRNDLFNSSINIFYDWYDLRHYWSDA